MEVSLLWSGCDTECRRGGWFKVWFGGGVSNHGFKQPAFEALSIACDEDVDPRDAVDLFEIWVDLNNGAIVEGHEIFAVGCLS